jgi:hypothetical protein
LKKKTGRRAIPPDQKIVSGTVCLSLADWAKLESLAEKAGVARGVIVARMLKRQAG